MVKKILQIGDQCLYQKSGLVTKQELASKETQKLIDDMLDTCLSEQESTAGLSAVQVGELKRIYIARRVDLPDDDENPEWEVLVNPEVEVLDKKSSRMWEGCLSIGEGDERIFGPVSRPRQVKVSYWDRQGNPKSFVAEDYMSHVIQHEQDHLNGVLFLNYVTNPANLWRAADLDDYIAEHDKYPPIE